MEQDAAGSANADRFRFSTHQRLLKQSVSLLPDVSTHQWRTQLLLVIKASSKDQHTYPVLQRVDSLPNIS